MISKQSILICVSGMTAGVIIFGTLLLFHLSHNTIINPNGWATVRGIGSADADSLTKALIAKIGIFANSKEQAIYLTGFEGEQGIFKKVISGKKLTSIQGGIHYQIIGNANIPSNWWSITLYDEQDFLHGNPDNRFSFSSFSIDADEAGRFVIDVSPTRPPDSINWLPSPTKDGFNLKLRIYEPLPDLYNNIATYELPKIVKVGVL
jgi:hypothetical protein